MALAGGEARVVWNRATIRLVSRELKKVRAQFGTVTARNVLEAARAPSHPLHAFFEWRNEVAAEKYRLAQARDMIGRVRAIVRIDGVEQPMRKWVHVTFEKKRQYMPIVEVKGNEELTDQVLRAARRELEGWMARYRQYERFLEPRGLVQRAIDSLPSDEEE